MSFARSKLGAPYDWLAIIEFLMPVALHEAHHFICSALMTLVAVKGGAFPALAKERHTVSPADLLFVLSGRVAINKTP
jgi:hypothetical protein